MQFFQKNFSNLWKNSKILDFGFHSFLILFHISRKIYGHGIHQDQSLIILIGIQENLTILGEIKIALKCGQRQVTITNGMMMIVLRNLEQFVKLKVTFIELIL